MAYRSPISRKAVLAVVLAVFSSSAAAYPGKRLQLEQLVTSSDLIVVADLSDIRTTGTIEGQVDGNAVTADVYAASLRVLRRLKGSSPDRVTVCFNTPKVFVGYPGIASGLQMAFLKKEKECYVFADRHYPTLPATSDVANSQGGSAGSPLDRVVAELGSVISSTTAPPADKWTVIGKAYGIPKLPSFAASLRLGLQNASDLDLKYRIESELISRGDLSQLSSAVNRLLGGGLTDKQKELFLSVIANEVKDPEAAPIVARLLHSEDVQTRRAGAEGMWHAASPSTVSALLKALQDEDERVRFYAVRALSDLNNEPRWGPSYVEFQGNQQQYLSHWQGWGDAHQK